MASAPPSYNPSYPPQQGYKQREYQQQKEYQRQRGYQQQRKNDKGHGYQQQGGYQPLVHVFQQHGYPPVVQQQTNIVINQQPIVICQPIVYHRHAVVYQPQNKLQINHMLHLFITLFIFPPWIFVWIALILYRE